MRLQVLAVRALGGTMLLAGAAVTVGLWLLMPARPFSVFGQGDVYAVLWPLVPTFFAGLIPSSTAFATRTLEFMSVFPGWWLRLRSVLVVILLSTFLVPLSGHSYLVPARNLALLIGLAYLAVSFIPIGMGWLPVVMYPVICWLIGTRINGVHAPWALPLRPPTDMRALWVSAIIGVVGVATFCTRGVLVEDRSTSPRRSRKALIGVAGAALCLGLMPACSSPSQPDAVSGSPDLASEEAVPTASDPRPQLRDAEGNYLALGDSYAVGYQPPSARASLSDGYVYAVAAQGSIAGVDLSLINLACVGTTTGSMASSTGCSRRLGGRESPVYGSTQLDAAVEHLRSHQGEVKVITVSLGGNDVASCAVAPDPAECVPRVMAEIRPALRRALQTLRDAAGADTLIVGVGYPNVLLAGFLTGPGPSRDLAAESVRLFRDVINPGLAEEYGLVGGRYVDVTRATSGDVPLTVVVEDDAKSSIPVAVASVCTLTWMCEELDIHPTSSGYATIADAVLLEISK